MPVLPGGDHGYSSLAGHRPRPSPSYLGDDVIAVALGFPSALALFLLLMERVEAALFPAPPAQTGSAHRPEPSPRPVPSETRP